MTKERIIATLAGLAFGLALGFIFGHRVGTSESTHASEGYFCCDREGKNCVLAGPSCGGMLVWCFKIGTSPGGNAVCLDWG